MLDRITRFLNTKEKEFLASMRQEEAEFETYRTLAALDVTPKSNKNLLLSPEAEEENKALLARLRKKFWNDERSPIVDRARPASLNEETTAETTPAYV